MGPLPSDAALTTAPTTTTLVLKVDATSYSIVLGVDLAIHNPTGCTSAERTALGNTSANTVRCYQLPVNTLNGTTVYTGGTNTRGWKILNVSDSANNGYGSARLYVSDLTSSDIIKFTGLKIVPAATNWGSDAANGPPCPLTGSCTNPGERHELKIIINNTLNIAPNTAGNYVMAMRTAGYFAGGPTGVVAPLTSTSPGGAYTPYGNSVLYQGMGTFNPFRVYKGGTDGVTNTTPPTAVCILGNNNATTRAFILGSTTVKCPFDNQIDLVSGVTVPDLANLAPLSFQAGNPVSPNASFGGVNGDVLQQTDSTTNTRLAYPNFSCRNKVSGDTSATCTPAITLTFTVVMLGPDSMVLSDSVGTASGGACKLTPADDGVDAPIGKPTPCHAKNKQGSSDGIDFEFTRQGAADLAAAEAAVPPALPATQCKDDPLTGVVCPCVDLGQCQGNILITANVTPAADRSFTFNASGEGVAAESPFTIRTNGIDPDTGKAGYGEFGNPQFTNLEALTDSGPWTFEARLTDSSWMNIPGDSNHKYDVDSIDCESDLNKPAFTDPITFVTTPAYIVSTWTVDSSSVKTKAIVTMLGKGDTVTCHYHVHKTSK